ncbi:helix-turn-helix transcriptional regulator [Streptomyces bauhiniae]|uniref:helix-turn-helix domain-containing protein n=1 Tax=Streptomyces bauhiniae TaxID=2340725 RepID=UPI0033229919
MHTSLQEHTGTRISRLRRERNLTQTELSQLSGVSISTLTKVEQGVIPASPYVVGRVAGPLRVSTAEIEGQPYSDELRADRLDVLIRPIREALDVYDLGADPDIHARQLATLHAESEDLCAKVRAGQIKDVASRVAGLIEEATTAAHTAGSRDGWLTLASLYRSAYDVATKLGYPDLAQLALTRLNWAAERASDAVLGGMYHYLRALTYLREGQYRTGSRLTTLGLATIEQAEESRERQVVTGQLHLGASVLAARAHDEHQAKHHLGEAERIAQATREAGQVHWLAFGPTNVKVHRVSVLAELDQYDKAVEAAERTMIPKDWPKSRSSHHYAEVARAQLWTGQVEAAFDNLLQARKTAPQQAKYHPLVRDTFHGLEAAQRRLPDSFLSFGSWLGPQR